ncbi:MAG: hypothetical protein HY666_00220 [Chloroflexi bacterium]|nr:hypothetical protein [Chloroflexota bacterium]
MPRIHPLKEEEVPSESRAYFERSRLSFGAVLQSTALYAYCPPILEGISLLGTSIERSRKLTRQLRCLINVKVAAIVGCPF